MRYRCDNKLVVVTGLPVAFVLPVLKILGCIGCTGIGFNGIHLIPYDSV